MGDLAVHWVWACWCGFWSGVWLGDDFEFLFCGQFVVWCVAFLGVVVFVVCGLCWVLLVGVRGLD